MKKKIFYNVDEVAEMLSISRSHGYKIIRQLNGVKKLEFKRNLRRNLKIHFMGQINIQILKNHILCVILCKKI